MSSERDVIVYCIKNVFDFLHIYETEVPYRKRWFYLTLTGANNGEMDCKTSATLHFRNQA